MKLVKIAVGFSILLSTLGLSAYAVPAYLANNSANGATVNVNYQICKYVQPTINQQPIYACNPVESVQVDPNSTHTVTLPEKTDTIAYILKVNSANSSSGGSADYPSLVCTVLGPTNYTPESNNTLVFDSIGNRVACASAVSERK